MEEAAAMPADPARVLNAFRNLVRGLRSADRAGIQKYGLGSAQIFVLRCLAQRQPLSVGDLAEMTATDQSTVSVIIGKLAARGLVESRRSEEDARRAELTLTRKGRNVAARVPQAFTQSFLAGLERLPKPRLRLLAETLQELVEAMDIAEEHPPMLMTDEEKPVRRRRPASAGRQRSSAKK